MSGHFDEELVLVQKCPQTGRTAALQAALQALRGPTVPAPASAPPMLPVAEPQKVQIGPLDC